MVIVADDVLPRPGMLPSGGVLPHSICSRCAAALSIGIQQIRLEIQRMLAAVFDALGEQVDIVAADFR